MEVLRSQHQNITQQQQQISGQAVQIAELTKLVSGLAQMQTDVLKCLQQPWQDAWLPAIDRLDIGLLLTWPEACRHTWKRWKSQQSHP